MKAPFAVQRIDHVVLRVADLPRSQAWYAQVLGCEVVRRTIELKGPSQPAWR